MSILVFFFLLCGLIFLGWGVPGGVGGNVVGDWCVCGWGLVIVMVMVVAAAAGVVGWWFWLGSGSSGDDACPRHRCWPNLLVC